jgi:hypothetical protein
LHACTEVVGLGVHVLVVRVRWDVACFLTVSVRWENLGEGVAHLELTVDRSVEEGLAWVETAVLTRTFCCRGKSVVLILIREACLVEFRSVCERGKFTVLVLGLLNHLLCLTEGSIHLKQAILLLLASGCALRGGIR